MSRAETWKNLDRLDGRFSVSSQGRVRNDVTGNILSPWKHAQGYMHIDLHVEGSRHRLKVHRLVCEAFFGTCPEGHEVRHLDGNKNNNHLENLRYGTRTENQADRLLHGTSNRGERCGLTNLKPEQVISAQMGYLSGEGSTRSWAANLGVSKQQAWKMLTGKTWKAEYAEAKRRLEQ